MKIFAMEEIVHFMCASRDCNLKFDTNKQLTMHKRKHDMILSLNKSNQCTSDETPTPTRFIRNCEAIGLFQDLQNVNPFEETFRQATEAVKKGQSLRVPTISSLGKPAGEDLHTPHIDLKDDTHSPVDKFVDCEVERVIRPEMYASIKSTAFSIPTTASTLIKENKTDNKKETVGVRYFITSNGDFLEIPCDKFEILKPNVSKLPISISAPVVQSLDHSKPHPLHNQECSAAVKKKLKETLLKTPKLKTTSSSQNSSLQEVSSSHQSKKEKQVPSLIRDDQEAARRRKSLERNRIAAMKCREKRKKWVADLREKYEKMCLTNQALAKEVVFLRKEVARLKGLLISSNQHQLKELSLATTATNLISPTSSPKRPTSRSDLETTSTSPLRGPREGLRLDIEGASRAVVMDLDSPLVRKDEILSSVALPTTPNERLISFTELDHDAEVVEVSEERATTTVIQVNPNALVKSSLVFS